MRAAMEPLFGTFRVDLAFAGQRLGLRMMVLPLDRLLANRNQLCSRECHEIRPPLPGHVHAYERMHRVYANKTMPAATKGPGTVYINIGDGGNREGQYDFWFPGEAGAGQVAMTLTALISFTTVTRC
jgi:hypothetical protein